MQQGNLKPLYMAQCVDELNERFDFPRNTPPKYLCNSVDTVLKNAREHRLQGDEEKSYVLYMKYLSIIHYIKELVKKDEFCKSFWQKYNKHNVRIALETAEKLSDSLKLRYSQLKQKAVENKMMEKKEKEEIEVKKQQEEHNDGNVVDELYNGFTVDSSEVSISCTALFNLLKQGKQKVLVVDARPESSFKESQMKFMDCVINVPQDVIVTGITASSLERFLPAKSKDPWSKRGSADLVILLDWETTTVTLTPGSVLYTLKNILLKWDPDIIYKNIPLILEGGYEEWLQCYPTFTTNPHVKPPHRKTNNVIEHLLDGIEYPNLNDDIIISPISSANPMVPPVNRASKPPISTLSTRPNVDRKAKAAALQTYEERAAAIQKLLKEKETLANSTLELEKSRLEAEKNWEQIRLQKEKEAEETMKQILQEQEEMLLQNIYDLEKLQLEKEQENQSLRSVLEEYKRKELQESMMKEDINQKVQEDEINMRIHMKEEELRKIATLRKEKLRERERRVAEDKGSKGDMKVDWKRLSEEQRARERTTAEYQEKEKLARQRLAQERLKIERQVNDSRRDLKAKEHQERHDAEQGSHVKSEQDKKVAKEKEDEHHMTGIKSQEILDRDKGIYLAPLKDVPSSGGGGMKRSHSSPNVTQLEDDANVRQKVPQYDRAVKPTLHPHRMDVRTLNRNFNPVHGFLGFGLTGLKNLGNTCYMNSIIQCLNNTMPLAFYFCGGKYESDINRNNETRGLVAEEVAAVISTLWLGYYRSITIQDLKNLVGQLRDQFQSNQQQDSNEFLTILMDWLHEDLKTPPPASKHDILRELSEAERHWQQFYKENTSFIVELFYGQQKSTVRCLRCKQESVRFETFSNLTLPLPSNTNKCTLEECVQLYLRGERITGWKCPSCKEQREATKKFDIIKLPPILIIHFKRFYMEGWCRKRQTFVDFPLYQLDMKKHTIVQEQKYKVYNLYGVSNHYGTTEGGHYTAYCNSCVYSKWYKFDDHEVREISPSEVKSGAAYILFYMSVEYKSH